MESTVVAGCAFPERCVRCCDCDRERTFGDGEQNRTRSQHNHHHQRWRWKPLRVRSFTLYFIFLIHLTMCYSSYTSRLTSYELWEHEATLDPDGSFVVQWTPADDHIVFRVSARTRGYIGFGLASNPRMDGADIAVGWVHSGKAYLQDRHGRGNEEPLVDEQQDWMLVGGYENETHTVLLMSRPYNTCDRKDHVISNDTVRILWAYHPDDPVDPESPRPRLHYHGGMRRGSRSIFLLGRRRKERRLVGSHHHEELIPWSLRNPDVEVSAATDTIYWCKLFRRPNVPMKHHVVKYEPVFSDGNEQYIHHMIVYECTGAPELDVAFHDLAATTGHECYQSNMSQLIFACNHVVAAWAVGAEGLTYPAEAGYPLTPEGPKFYMMEVHYDNPDGVEFTDSSGIKFQYTPQLRNFDAGLLSVGLDPNWKHLIPPRQKIVLSEGHCVPECTAAAFPHSGIHVFATILHTHLLGRKVRVRHIRNEEELEPIANDNNYDFSYQEYRTMRTPRRVLPGDHLISECTYSSRDRSTITLGGYKTRDEVCLSFLFYWPRVDLSFCHSKPSLSTVLQSLGIQELSADSDPIKIRRPIELAGKTLEWRLVNYDWRNYFEYFQRATHTGTFNPMCWRRGHSLVPELEKIDYEYPNVTRVWEQENICRRHKRKNRKWKNKGRGRTPIPPVDEGDDEGVDEEVMADDETDAKLIERIDVDPYKVMDIMLPVHEGQSDNGDVDALDDDRVRSENEEIKRELKEVEHELEQELAGKYPDLFHERTRHPNSKSVSVGTMKRDMWTPVVMCCSGAIYLRLYRNILLR